MSDVNLARIAATLALAGLAGCSGSGTESGSTLTVAGEVPIAYAKRSTTLRLNPTNGAPFAAGGDLMVREKSSPSAREFNVTAAITQGKGDVSDPEVSYDGRKIVFALRCPTSNTSTVGGVAACTGRWNIWEYDMSAGGLSGGSLRRITGSTTDDDVDPAYLPADRGFVFASNRQTTTKTQALGQTYYARRRVRARARAEPAHDRPQRRRHHADLRQPEPRPQPGGAAQRRHHVLALGARRPAQPLRDLPRQARRHRHVRAVRRAQQRQQLPAPARHGPERPVQGQGAVLADAAVGHAGGRRADADRRRQLLRREHAGQRAGRRAGRPGAVDREGNRPRPRPVAVRPRHGAVPAVGRHQPRAAGVPAVRSDAQRPWSSPARR